jgi:two-component system sporulation sensor kinase B
MSVIGPVRNADDFVLGLHLIEARANYFNVLTNLKNRLFIFSLINFLLIVLIAVGLFRAIRRTLHYEREIREREHLVQLGQMAATVAHEIRNPLGIIEGTNDLLQKKYGSAADEVFTYIPKEIERLQNLIENFLKFARIPQLHIRSFSLAELVQRITLGLNKQEQERFSIQKENRDQVITSDESLLEQALLNIINNAMQATVKKGIVSLEYKISGRKQFLIIVSDTGEGIRDEDITKIFKPFYTTKETGTGLGLAISRRLIIQLGGNIYLSSKLGTGTKISIILPRVLKEQS